MKKVGLILVLFLSISLQSSAQKRSLTESISYYLSINGTTKQYDQAVTSLVDMLKQQYASKNAPQSVWDELYAKKSKEVNKIKYMLASAYRSHFTAEELVDMIDFYETSTGQQMVNDQTLLTQGDRDKMSFFFNSKTGKKILQESDELNRLVSEISEIWSRDLYRSMTDHLAEKGYSL